MAHPASFLLINTTKTTLGPTSLVQYLHSQKLNTDYIYAPKNADNLYSDNELKLLVKEARFYDIVGVSSFTISETRAFQLVKAIRSARRETFVVVGGPNVIMDPERALRESGANSVCTYEGEFPVENLLRTFHDGTFTTIAGLWFNVNGRIVKNPYAGVLRDLDKIGFENVKKSPYGSYKRLTPHGFAAEGTMVERIDNPCTRGTFLYMMTTRGCPYSCSYCINSTLNEIARATRCRRIRRMSLHRIISTLHDMKRSEHKFERIFFFDDDFFLRTENALLAFRKLYRRKVGLPFYVFANPNSTTNRKLDIAVEAGLAGAEFGVQTVSSRILYEYSRASNEASFRRILKHATDRKYDGLQISLDLISNSPFEKTEDVLESIKYVLSLRGTFQLYVHNLHLFPGSPLWKRHGGKSTGNEYREYQDNVSPKVKRYFNEYHTKILFSMQGWHSLERPNMYGTLSRRQIEKLLAVAPADRKRNVPFLNEKMARTRVAKYYAHLQ